jgi:hypothetical protein
MHVKPTTLMRSWKKFSHFLITQSSFCMEFIGGSDKWYYCSTYYYASGFSCTSRYAPRHLVLLTWPECLLIEMWSLRTLINNDGLKLQLRRMQTAGDLALSRIAWKTSLLLYSRREIELEKLPTGHRLYIRNILVFIPFRSEALKYGG